MSKSDYWEDNGQVFVHYGQRFGIAPNLRTVIIPDELSNTDTTLQDASQPVEKTAGDSLAAPVQFVTDKTRPLSAIPVIVAGDLVPGQSNQRLCKVCGQVVPGKRSDRELCSPKCRKAASRSRQLEMAGV